MSKRKLKPVFEKEDLGNNYFTSIDNLKIRVNVGTIEGIDDDGDVVRKDYEYEKTPYCKVFSDVNSRLIVSNLTAPAKELLMWIIYELDPAKDYFWLNRTRYMQECNIKSPTSVVSAVKQLEGKFIAPTKVREIYFINPNFIYHGSRIKNFPNNIVNGKKKR